MVKMDSHRFFDYSLIVGYYIPSMVDNIPLYLISSFDEETKNKFWNCNTNDHDKTLFKKENIYDLFENLMDLKDSKRDMCNVEDYKKIRNNKISRKVMIIDAEIIIIEILIMVITIEIIITKKRTPVTTRNIIEITNRTTRNLMKHIMFFVSIQNS